MNFTHKASPVGPDGVVRCYHHGKPATKLTSKTDRNPGREFWRCSYLPPEKCDFWMWTDDPRTISNSSQTPPSSPARKLNASTPSQSQLQGLPRASTGPSSSPHQTLSQKRERSPSPVLTPNTQQQGFLAAPMTPPSTGPRSDTSMSVKGKRLAELQAGLDARNSAKDDTATEPLLSSARTNTLCTRDVKRVRPIGSTDADVEARARTNGLSLTPESPTLGKGKGTNHSDPFQTQVNTDNSPCRQPLSLRSTPSGPMLGEVKQEEALGQSLTITNIINNLHLIPEHVQWLERKRIAAEKSNEAKALKIALQEAEIDMLRKKVASLEQMLNAMMEE